jgi:hypothetical protein
MPNDLTRSDFTGRKLENGKKKARVPARVAKLVDLMIWGDPDTDTPALSLDEAARKLSIKLKSAREYLRHPTARAHYLANLAQLRDSERARNLHTAIGIRDSSAKEESAAHRRVAVEAMHFLEGEPEDMRRYQQPSAHVSPGIVVQVSVGNRSLEVDDTLIEVNPGVPS